MYKINFSVVFNIRKLWCSLAPARTIAQKLLKRMSKKIDNLEKITGMQDKNFRPVN